MSNPFEHLIPSYIQQFESYIPSKPDDELKKIFGIDHLYRLNNNENFMGPSKKVKEFMQNVNSGLIPVYPNGDSYNLRYTLAEKFGKLPEQFLVGNGSNEVITCVLKAFCEQGDNIITTNQTYAVYEWVAEFSGIEARLVSLDENMAFDPQRILDAIDRHTKIIFICNPNNPTGTYWSKQEMIGFLEKVNNRCIVVIDEAYFEYVEAEDYANGMKLMEQFPNVVVFRTFSKMYALASLRIGYLVASMDVISLIRKTYVVYSVNSLAQMTAQLAISNDEELIDDTRLMVRNGKKILADTCSRLDLYHTNGEGNFMMVKVPVPDTLLYKKLIRKGYIIRTMTGFRFPEWIRVSILPEEIMQGFCESLEEVLS